MLRRRFQILYVLIKFLAQNSGIFYNLDYKWLIYLQVIVFVHRMLFLLMVKILALNVRKILLAMMQLPVAQIALVLLRGRLVATTSRVHWTVEIASKS